MLVDIRFHAVILQTDQFKECRIKSCNQHYYYYFLTRFVFIIKPTFSARIESVFNHANTIFGLQKNKQTCMELLFSFSFIWLCAFSLCIYSLWCLIRATAPFHQNTTKQRFRVVFSPQKLSTKMFWCFGLFLRTAITHICRTFYM